MNALTRRITQNRAGVALALAAVLAVGGRRLWVIAQRPAHWQAVAAEWGSVPQFGRVVIPNHHNTHLLFNRQIENSMGFHFCDIATHKVRLLCQTPPPFYGWSPDDSRFAYGLARTNVPGQWEIVICDGKSGERIAELQHPGFTGPGMFVWLSERVFAYILNSDLAVVEQRPDGTWYRARLVPGVVPPKTVVSCFTRLSDTAVAWQEGNRIQWLEAGASAPKTLWEGRTNRLEDFLWSSETGELLLKCSDRTGQDLLRYCPRTGLAQAAGKIDPTHRATFKPQSDWLDDSPTFIAWRGGWPRTLRLSDDGLNTFHVGTPTNLEAQCLAWVGGVTAHTTLNGDHLYVIGHPANQPPGVWDYDVATGTLNCAVATEQPRFRHALTVAPTYDQLTNAAGQVRGYSVWAPARLDHRKKYPLIIGQTANSEMLPYEEMAANCGCYFAVVHRGYWMSRRLRDWPADVIALYGVLAAHPNVDTNRVFLWGRSAEAPSVTQLFLDQPGLWQGVIYCDSRSLPEVASLRGKTVLFITGKDAGDMPRLLKYQDQAFEAGIPLRLRFQEKSGHSPVCVRVTRERTEMIARFLVEDL
jgi:hypothetical protein